MSRYWSELLPSLPANRTFSIGNYGAVLKANKVLLNAAFDAAKVLPKYRALMLAMAFIETVTLSSAQRDTTKNGLSANYSLFNLNSHLILETGFSGDLNFLNKPEALTKVVEIILKGVSIWGVEGLLNFNRGGMTAFKDGKSYGVWDYRNSIATILKILDAQPSLFFDERRININLPYV